MNAARINQNPAQSAPIRRAGTSAPRQALARPRGPQSAPSDLLSFVGSCSEAQAACILRLSKGTVSRLKAGYWPADSSKIMRAWNDCKARRGVIVSTWSIRRVRAGGVVRYAGRVYSAARLAARVGQSLALARDADGRVVAQTLGLPAERLLLEPTGS